MLRSVRLVAVTLVLALGFVVMTAPPAPAQKVPADFTFEQGKGSPGPVTFSHEAHKAKVEKCNGCHTKIFKMKKGQTGTLTMAKMKAGEECGACHNGKSEIGGVKPADVADKAKCESCHKKK